MPIGKHQFECLFLTDFGPVKTWKFICMWNHNLRNKELKSPQNFLFDFTLIIQANFLKENVRPTNERTGVCYNFYFLYLFIYLGWEVTSTLCLKFEKKDLIDIVLLMSLVLSEYISKSMYLFIVQQKLHDNTISDDLSK